MNFKMMGRFWSRMLLAEGLFMIPPLVLSVFDGTVSTTWGFGITVALLFVIGGVLAALTHNAPKGFFAKEGFFCVSSAWVLLSLFGALPLAISGGYANYIDALFEIISGFTTTGATVLSDVESLSRGVLYWRSFSHWLGGMGVLVLLLAVSGKETSSYTMQLFRAESPGPDVGKLSPRLRDTARLLYGTYIVLTVLNFLFLLKDLSVFESLCTALGTAGTGGFALHNDSLASATPYVQWVTTAFMLLFSVNFACYYLILLGKGKAVLQDDELRLFVGIVLVSGGVIAYSLCKTEMCQNAGDGIRLGFFSVASIISTTGYGVFDMNQYSTLAQSVMLLLMVTGACAGSTCGGLKLSRVLILLRSGRRNLAKLIHPGRVSPVRINKKGISEEVISGTHVYLALYCTILLFSFLGVCIFDGDENVLTNFTSVLTCFNNVGPALGNASATMGAFSVPSKIILMVDMLAGRLEIFPLLALLGARE